LTAGNMCVRLTADGWLTKPKRECLVSRARERFSHLSVLKRRPARPAREFSWGFAPNPTSPSGLTGDRLFREHPQAPCRGRKKIMEF